MGITKWIKRIIITIPYPKNKILSSSIKSLFSSKNQINIFYQILSFLIIDEQNLETNKEKYYYYMNIVLDTFFKEKEKENFDVLMKYIKEEEKNYNFALDLYTCTNRFIDIMDIDDKVKGCSSCNKKRKRDDDNDFYGYSMEYLIL